MDTFINRVVKITLTRTSMTFLLFCKVKFLFIMIIFLKFSKPFELFKGKKNKKIIMIIFFFLFGDPFSVRIIIKYMYALSKNNEEILC